MKNKLKNGKYQQQIDSSRKPVGIGSKPRRDEAFLGNLSIKDEAMLGFRPKKEEMILGIKPKRQETIIGPKDDFNSEVNKMLPENCKQYIENSNEPYTQDCSPSITDEVLVSSKSEAPESKKHKRFVFSGDKISPRSAKNKSKSCATEIKGSEKFSSISGSIRSIFSRAPSSSNRYNSKLGSKETVVDSAFFSTKEISPTNLSGRTKIFSSRNNSSFSEYKSLNKVKSDFSLRKSKQSLSRPAAQYSSSSNKIEGGFSPDLDSACSVSDQRDSKSFTGGYSRDRLDSVDRTILHFMKTQGTEEPDENENFTLDPNKHRIDKFSFLNNENIDDDTANNSDTDTISGNSSKSKSTKKAASTVNSKEGVYVGYDYGIKDVKIPAKVETSMLESRLPNREPIPLIARKSIAGFTTDSDKAIKPDTKLPFIPRKSFSKSLLEEKENLDSDSFVSQAANSEFPLDLANAQNIELNADFELLDIKYPKPPDQIDIRDQNEDTKKLKPERFRDLNFYAESDSGSLFYASDTLTKKKVTNHHSHHPIIQVYNI
ncbi:hypothetical protein AYI69_g671 [Smittium culicis]|uniref:Uncharacterized protein n=1 Tax=Smittium culicis TaxID=133412 RepID=A0A1R1YSF3_9FUNG|nr:hypothetical protein AYI69_g671 [Smittium culicis]